ncbi:MAG: Alpha/beta hydrolase fold-3 domain protein [Polaromonas sp.]|nr:Alpha/beta hydrolase fold-3 domain protein [Polaromonas sp.]
MKPFTGSRQMNSISSPSFSTVQTGLPWTHQQIDVAPHPPLGVRFYGRHSDRAGAALPLVVHFHAGAFVAGSLETGSCIARLLADAGAVVMSLDYPLAPSHPFPHALQAGYAALMWAWKARGKLAGKGAPVFVAGEEAGGNLAAAIALMARDQQLPMLAGQVLLSPMLDACLGTASLRGAQAGPVGCTWADGWRDYLSRLDNAGHPYAAPGAATRLASLPPTLLLTAQDDPFRDESLAYAVRLRGAGRVVHGAVLPGPTGWPGSYLQPASHEAAWAPAVQQQFKNFFSDLSGGAASGDAAHTLFSTASPDSSS